MLEWQQHAQQLETQLAESQADLAAARTAEGTAAEVQPYLPLLEVYSCLLTMFVASLAGPSSNAHSWN